MRFEVTSREGSRLSDTDAQLLSREFDRLRRKFGQLTRDIVVDEAKKPNSKLHRFFEWDLATAAEAHWLARAGDLLRSVVVRIVDHGQKREPVRALIVVTKSGGQRSYEPLLDVLQRPEWRSEMLSRARAELAAFQRRFASLEELSSVFAAIRRLKVA
jgi:hypothetical protein